MKSLLFLVSFLLAASVSLAAADDAAGDSRRELLDGGWQPIKNVNDQYVVEIAKFAIDAHNKNSQKHLTLLKVASGETQIVDGVNYRLVLFADERSYSIGFGEYEATVWVKSEGDHKELTSFKTLRP